MPKIILLLFKTGFMTGAKLTKYGLSGRILSIVSGAWYNITLLILCAVWLSENC